MEDSQEIQCLKYTDVNRGEWDGFVERSRNGTFLFHRGYMEYHKSRFQDESIMLKRNGKLIALFPATLHEEEIVSHGGLTYGGLIVDRGFHGSESIDAFNTISSYYRRLGYKKITYKVIPHIYHSVPAQEDLYGLFRVGAELVRRDLSTTINLRNKYKYSKGRKAILSKLKNKSYTVERSEDFHTFMGIEKDLLNSKHGVDPVHSSDEMKLLADKFPANIFLYVGLMEDEMLGGVIVYKTNTVCHAQYIAATDKGKSLNVIDACIERIISDECDDIEWFDFGISTTQAGKCLDINLIKYKESWGGRGITYDHYEICL